VEFLKMAVGDMVSGFSAASTQLYFQPAAGIVILITSVGGVSAWAQLTDGIITTGYTVQTGTGESAGNTKVFINNSLYLTILATTYNTTYTGIQVQ